MCCSVVLSISIPVAVPPSCACTPLRRALVRARALVASPPPSPCAIQWIAAWPRPPWIAIVDQTDLFDPARRARVPHRYRHYHLPLHQRPAVRQWHWHRSCQCQTSAARRRSCVCYCTRDGLTRSRSREGEKEAIRYKALLHRQFLARACVCAPLRATYRKESHSTSQPHRAPLPPRGAGAHSSSQ